MSIVCADDDDKPLPYGHNERVEGKIQHTSEHYFIFVYFHCWVWRWFYLNLLLRVKWSLKSSLPFEWHPYNETYLLALISIIVLHGSGSGPWTISTPPIIQTTHPHPTFPHLLRSSTNSYPVFKVRPLFDFVECDWLIPVEECIGYCSVISPGYPNSYPDDVTCSYLLTNFDDSRVELKIGGKHFSGVFDLKQRLVH